MLKWELYMLKKQRWQTAIIHYQRALLESPKLVAVYLKLSYALSKVGKAKQAQICLQEGIKFNPLSPQLYFQLGLFYTQQQQWPQATNCRKC